MRTLYAVNGSVEIRWRSNASRMLTKPGRQVLRPTVMDDAKTQSDGNPDPASRSGIGMLHTISGWQTDSVAVPRNWRCSPLCGSFKTEER
jgi:hypothetical protein